MGSGASSADTSELGRRLKTMRIERGMAAEEVSAIAGIHPTTLSRIEGGGEDPKWSTVRKIMQGLGADLSDLA